MQDASMAGIFSEKIPRQATLFQPGPYVIHWLADEGGI
jgi:hypothetical protein